MRHQVWRRLAILAAGGCLFGIVIAVPSMAPTASADQLPNGYNVTCTPRGANQADCDVSGCPQVRPGEAADTIHVNYNAQPGNEVSFPCNNTGDMTREFLGETVDNSLGFDFFIQGCRKHALSSDDCGAVSHYHYTPPPKAAPPAPANNAAPPVNCPAGSVTATVPAGQQCQAAPPVSCPAGSESPTVPAGQQCQAAPPPKDAVTLTFQKEGLQIQAIIVNNSTVAGQCQYQAVNTNGIIPERTDNFPIGAKATVTRTYPAPPPLAQFHATVTCTGDFNGTTDEFGNTSADVTG